MLKEVPLSIYATSIWSTFTPLTRTTVRSNHRNECSSLLLRELLPVGPLVLGSPRQDSNLIAKSLILGPLNRAHNIIQKNLDKSIRPEDPRSLHLGSTWSSVFRSYQTLTYYFLSCSKILIETLVTDQMTNTREFSSIVASCMPYGDCHLCMWRFALRVGVA